MEEVRLKDYIKTLKGYAFKSEFYKNKGTPIIRVSDFTENSISDESLEYIDSDLFDNYKKFSLKEKDILIQTVGSWQNNPASVVGKVVNVPFNLNSSLLNQNAVKIIPVNIYQDFLYYLLKSDYFKYYILSTAQGAANQASITLESIGKFKFMLPSREDQKRIGTILFSYDNLIENNNKRIKLLENMAEELYKEWFVRLRFPNYQNTKIVDGIPTGWCWRTIGESVNNFDSKRKPISKENREKIKGKYPYYGASSILDYVNDFIFEGKYLLLGEDGTVITKRGTPMLQFIEGSFWVSNHAHVLTGKLVSTEYLYLFLNSFSISGYITGTAQPKINQENLNSIKISLPTEETLDKFNKIVIPIFDEIKILQKKNENLKQTRDLLLPRLISGKLDIEDLEIV